MAHPSLVKSVIMTNAKTLGQAFDALLQPEKFRDYGPNGLQVEGDREIKLIVSGVTASRALIEAAIAAQAQPVSRAGRPEDIAAARAVVDEVAMDDRIKDYIVNIVVASRDPKAAKVPLDGLVAFGASPRATLALSRAARAHAFLDGRGYVVPQDVKDIAPMVLRHRVVPSFEAEAEEKTGDDLVRILLEHVAVP